MWREVVLDSFSSSVEMGSGVNTRGVVVGGGVVVGASVWVRVTIS